MAAVIVGVLLIGAVSAFAYINSITSSLHEGVDQDLRAALVETDMANEPFYMLLLGTDKISWREGTEDGGVYRSDTMILARVDAPQGTISLISIPRDTLVDMGQNGWQKINAAYGLGGPSYAVEMVSKLTGVDISHYAEVDMDGLSLVGRHSMASMHSSSVVRATAMLKQQRRPISCVRQTSAWCFRR